MIGRGLSSIDTVLVYRTCTIVQYCTVLYKVQKILQMKEPPFNPPPYVRTVLYCTVPESSVTLRIYDKSIKFANLSNFLIHIAVINIVTE